MKLRALARDYANGVIGAQAYRKARDELIENILLGTTKVTAHDFLPPLIIQRVESMPDVTGIMDITAASPPSPAVNTTNTGETRENTEYSSPPPRRGMMLGISAIILLLIAAVALYPFLQQEIFSPRTTGQITSPATPPPQTHREPATVLNRGEALIKDFLQQNNWTDERLQQFISDWQNLSSEEKDAGLLSSSKTELANAIYRKLQEERIMMQGLGDVQSSQDKQTNLVGFAQQIGIDDPRLVISDTP